MLAAYAARVDAEAPLTALAVGDLPEPAAPRGWVRVRLAAAALNHHDLWSLRGVGLDAERLPMVLGCDGAGVDQDGNEVIVHAVISSPDHRGDETLDPARSLLSERYPGTLAEYVAVPRRNLVPKPAELSWVEAACLPTAWLTAYRMLFTASGVRPGGTVLVQGAGGGVATAAIRLGAAAGIRVWVTARDEAKAQRALGLGAAAVFEAGQRLPEPVDAVLETVGAATWTHSIRSLRPGGTLVIAGATSGAQPERTELNRIFFLQLRVVGSTMGTREELERLVALCARTGIRPEIDTVYPLSRAAEALGRLEAGQVVGKLVCVPD